MSISDNLTSYRKDDIPLLTKMEFEQLTERDTEALDRMINNGQVSRRTLPVGVCIGLDSMGPVRDSTTDILYPGAQAVLGRFSKTLRDYNMMLAVATNGPDVEGEDILRALVGPVAAFAVTEGGGKLISRHPQTGQLEHTQLADEKELGYLADLERKVAERSLMAALLGDRRPVNEGSPIRTPYDTNIVLTLPTSYDILNARLSAIGVNLRAELPTVNPAEFVKQVLGYAHDQYIEVIQRLGLDDHIAVLTKLQNRRTYVMPKHNHAGELLTKYSGVELGSRHMSFAPGYYPQRYEMGNSIYIADKAVDQTGEGQLIIGASERSMITGVPTYFGEESPNPQDVNVMNITPVTWDGSTIYLGEIACRLAMNVTLDDSLPKIDRVEGVPILHIGSGLKALEGISYIYQRLHD